MGVLGFENRGSMTGKNWNYSDPNKDNYYLQLQGTVVEIKEVPATKFNSNEIDRWPDGNPKLNICLTIQGQSGRELDWVFSPGGTQKPTPAMAACRAALQAAGEPAQSVAELGGKTITVATQAPPEGFTYGQGNPRPWAVQINGAGTVPFRGVHEYTGEAQQQAQPQPQPQVQPQPQPQPQAQVQPQPQQAQSVMAQPNTPDLYDHDIPF